MLQANPAYAVLFVVSMLFPALASIFKERIFAKEVGFIESLSVIAWSLTLHHSLRCPELGCRRSVSMAKIWIYLW